MHDHLHLGIAQERTIKFVSVLILKVSFDILLLDGKIEWCDTSLNGLSIVEPCYWFSARTKRGGASRMIGVKRGGITKVDFIGAAS